MRIVIQRERIRVIPVPYANDHVITAWLKTPLSKGNKPYVSTEVVAGKKFYDLPCPLENINMIVIKPKE